MLLGARRLPSGGDGSAPIVGAVPGYLLGVWFAQRFAGVPLSPYAKGWVSLAMFIGGLAVLAIATR